MMSLRTRLLFPTTFFLLLWGGYMLVHGRDTHVAPGVLLAILAVLVLVTIANVEVFLLRPLRVLKQTMQDLAGNPLTEPPPATGSGELRELTARLKQLRDRMQEHDVRLARESSRRQEIEHSLRELEERYSLTVERANDGIWEWDVKSGAAQFSLRWKGMLGYLDSGMSSIEDWKQLLHRDDREAVTTRLDNHMQWLTPHFEAEYRVRDAGGRYRWLSSRGTALRHASGNPYRVVVMDNDIHTRKDLEETLIQAAEGLSSVSGMDFFQSLMKSLSAILGTRDNMVCYCPDDPPTRAHTLAYYSSGEFWENFEYDLAGTSCGAVIEKKEIVYCPTGVCDIWPDEKQYDRDSYIGVPMFDWNGRIIGHFACMDGQPMRQDLPHLALFKIFSVRAAAELERLLLKQRLGE